jgi:serine phosphatase RsbU (regulator of sigma subunit)
MNLRAVTSHILFRLVGRPLVFAVPFALFFFIMNGERLSDLPWYYLAALIFSTYINLANLANAQWVVPRLTSTRRTPEGRPLALEIASFAVASLTASLAAALTLHLTIVPGMLGSPKDVLQLVTYSCFFVVLVRGVIYAVRFQRQIVDRIRTEAERKGREEQELKTAAEIQQALLPPRSIAGATFTVSGASIPCRTIGGDFYDTFELPDGRLGFALGDVAGKGPPAAILAAMVQGILASHVGAGASPAETLDRVNKAVLRRAIESRFATLVYGLLSADGTLVASNAGHNPTFLFRADGRLERLDKGGLMVGAFDFAAYEEERAALRPGDTLVLYSDGATDATSPSGEQFGEERLLAALATAHRETPDDLVARLLQEIRAFADGEPPADDVTLLVVRFVEDARSRDVNRSTF